jgi:hypothetical protein
LAAGSARVVRRSSHVMCSPADHLKGSLHRVLREARALRELFVVPMITEAWEDTHFETYARLLGLVDAGRVIPRAVFCGRQASRRNYFAAALDSLPRGADVLLDPNTGLGHSIRGQAHFLIEELPPFVTLDPKRLVIVYDESRDHRVPKRQHVNGIGRRLRSRIGPAVVYDAGRSLSVFMVSRDRGRVARAYRVLERFLGPAARRVRLFP